MESHAPPGTIQVTQRTRNHLADRFELVRRDDVLLVGHRAQGRGRGSGGFALKLLADPEELWGASSASQRERRSKCPSTKA
jgi:hypothetical protein